MILFVAAAMLLELNQRRAGVLGKGALEASAD